MQTIDSQIVPKLSSELRKFIRLFWPILLGQLAQTAMGVVDTVMAGIAGTKELSGVAIGTSFFYPPVLALIGLTLAIQPTLAHLIGSGHKDKIPYNIHIASIVCFIFSILLAILICLAPLLFELVSNIDPRMRHVGTYYLYAIACGMPGFAIFNVLRAYCEGQGITMPTFIFGILSLLINIPLNYIFIFGKFGAPQLGGIGCGVATSCAVYISDIIFLIYVLKAKRFESVRIYQQFFKVKLHDIWVFLKLGMPLSLSSTIEVSSFAMVAYLLSGFGPVMVSGHTIALNVSGLLFMIPLSIASVSTIRVGESIVLGHFKRAMVSLKASFIMGLGSYIFTLCLILFFHNFIVSLYTNDHNVFAIAIPLLMLCAMYLLPDTIQVISIGILRGFKDSKTIFIVSVISYWCISMPLGYILAHGILTDYEFAARGFWIGFICGLSTAAIIYISRLVYIFKNKKLPFAKPI